MFSKNRIKCLAEGRSDLQLLAITVRISEVCSTCTDAGIKVLQHLRLGCFTMAVNNDSLYIVIMLKTSIGRTYSDMYSLQLCLTK